MLLDWIFKLGGGGKHSVLSEKETAFLSDVNIRLTKLEKKSDDRDAKLEEKLAAGAVMLKRHDEILIELAKHHENDGQVEMRLAQMQEAVAGLSMTIGEAKGFAKVMLGFLLLVVFLAGVLSPEVFGRIARGVARIMGWA